MSGHQSFESRPGAMGPRGPQGPKGDKGDPGASTVAKLSMRERFNIAIVAALIVLAAAALLLFFSHSTPKAHAQGQNFGGQATINCSTAAACSPTTLSNAREVVGSAPLVSNSPSAVTITGISPAFTSSTSYFCIVTDATTATNNLLKVANVSGSSFTITGPNTITDTINYQCVGN